MAQKYADENILGPTNAIWCNAVINGNKDTAQKIWSEHIQNERHVEYRPITERAIKDNDDVMLLGLIECLRTPNASLPVSNDLNIELLSIYLNNERLDDALKIAGTLNSNQRWIRPNDLKRLKTSLEKDGKEFPFVEADLVIEFDSVEGRIE